MRTVYVPVKGAPTVTRSQVAAYRRDLEAAAERARSEHDAAIRERDRLERRHVHGMLPPPQSPPLPNA